jgi:hypothetical protein
MPDHEEIRSLTVQAERLAGIEETFDQARGCFTARAEEGEVRSVGHSKYVRQFPWHRVGVDHTDEGFRLAISLRLEQRSVWK